MRRAKSLSRPILVESGWNWNLKFGFLGQYGQKTIFQNKWTKNTDEQKVHLVWFSSTVWRGHFALNFFAQNTWKENVTKYLCYFRKFSVQDHLHEYLWAVLYFFRLCLRGFNLYLFYIIKSEPSVGETLIDIESAEAKQTKKSDFVSFKTFCQQQFFTTIKGIFKNTFWI